MLEILLCSSSKPYLQFSGNVWSLNTCGLYQLKIFYPLMGHIKYRFCMTNEVRLHSYCINRSFVIYNLSSMTAINTSYWFAPGKDMEENEALLANIHLLGHMWKFLYEGIDYAILMRQHCISSEFIKIVSVCKPFISIMNNLKINYLL